MNTQALSQLGSKVSSLDDLLSSSTTSAQGTCVDLTPGVTTSPVSTKKKKVHFDSKLSQSTPHLPIKVNPSTARVEKPLATPLGKFLTRDFENRSLMSKSDLDLTSISPDLLSVKIREMPELRSPVLKEPLSSVMAETKELEVKSSAHVDVVSRHQTPPQSIQQTDRSTPTLESNQISLSREDLRKIVTESAELLSSKQNQSPQSFIPVHYSPPVPYPSYTVVTPYFYHNNPVVLTPVPPIHYHMDYPPPRQYLTTAEVHPSQSTQTSLSFEQYCGKPKSPEVVLASKISKIPISVNKFTKSESVDKVQRSNISTDADSDAESNPLETNSYRTNLQLFGYKPVRDRTGATPDQRQLEPESQAESSVARSEPILYHSRPMFVEEQKEPLSREEEFFSLPSDSTPEHSLPPPVNYSTLPRSLPLPTTSWQEIFHNTPPLQLPDPSSSMESAMSIDPIVGSRTPSARPIKVGTIASYVELLGICHLSLVVTLALITGKQY